MSRGGIIGIFFQLTVYGYPYEPSDSILGHVALCLTIKIIVLSIRNICCYVASQI